MIRSLFVGVAALALTAGAAFAQEDYGGDYRDGPYYRDGGDYRDAPHYRDRDDYRDAPYYRDDRAGYRDDSDYSRGSYYRYRPYYDEDAPATHALAGGAASAALKPSSAAS